MDEIPNKATRDFLDSQSYDELQWLISRYCGPNNELLFLKNYSHLQVKQRVFHREIQHRLFNSLLEEELNSSSDTIKE